MRKADFTLLLNKEVHGADLDAVLIANDNTSREQELFERCVSRELSGETDFS